ncbi:hypothetical protein CBR_g17650 [Chara braunii]|uniref:HAT C-terminal dimerisation domain-containing protein n=1 Tax=Chara braunii TaxID=69332 RepID=A0A388KV43_CHABU|nr:hypothetical protein CBR_g17650 [Chara braunii]|eukprot:GBG73935.1 hypothetical protein CBR_g17650 [Chara braunii]
MRTLTEIQSRDGDGKGGEEEEEEEEDGDGPMGKEERRKQEEKEAEDGDGEEEEEEEEDDDLLELVRAAEEEENNTGDGGSEGGDVGADVGDEGGRQVGRGGELGLQSCSGVEDIGGRAVDVRGACRGEAGPSRANALQARVCNRGVLLLHALMRFGTHFVMLDRLLTCERALRRLVLGDSWTKMDWQPYIRTDAYEVESLITDRAFWADLKKLYRVMKGPYDVLRMVDKDIHCLSKVYDTAVDLKNCVLHAPLTDDERDSILRDVGKRTDMLLNPVHAVARLLDPRLRDITVFSNLDLMAQFDSVVDRLVAKNGSQKFTDCKNQLYDFQFSRGIFGDAAALRREDKDNAVLWWEAHRGGHPELKMLAMKVLSIWTTSSPAERNWSTWSLVQTKTRNQLKHKRTEKLVYSHWNLRLKSKGEDGLTVTGGWLGLEQG